MDIKVMNLVLDQTVGIGDTRMLTQMLGPGLDQEGFDHAALLGSVLEHTPSVGAVTPTFLLNPVERREELFAVLGVDFVFDRDHNRTLICIKPMNSDRCRPMQRRSEIGADGGKQFPAPCERQGGKDTTRRHEIGVGQANHTGQVAPKRAAYGQGAEEKHDKHRTEFRYGSLRRSVTLPGVADDEHISARYDRGVLEVTVPLKEPEPQGRQIPIEA